HTKQKEEDIAVCECKYNASVPDSACGERCLNVLTSTECMSGYCPCGDYCKNQRFQKCEYAKTKVFKTEGHGWGLLADEDIKFIIEYCGEVIPSEEAKRRSQTYEAQATQIVRRGSGQLWGKQGLGYLQSKIYLLQRSWRMTTILNGMVELMYVVCVGRLSVLYFLVQNLKAS
ncbi:hypothetical protein RJ639_000608, partial [Escallonia herrerae]